MRDSQKNDCWSYLKKVRQSHRVPASWKSLSDILQDEEKSDWQTANIGGTVFEISCFMEKSDRYYESIGWKWVPATSQNFGWLSRQWDVSVNMRVLEVTCNDLSVFLGNSISFWGLWWNWRIDSYNYALVMIKDKVNINIVTVILAWYLSCYM